MTIVLSRQSNPMKNVAVQKIVMRAVIIVNQTAATANLHAQAITSAPTFQIPKNSKFKVKRQSNGAVNITEI